MIKGGKMENNNIMLMIDDKREIVEVFFDIANHLEDKTSKEGFENLTENEKNLFRVSKLLNEVNNCGFNQYFLNTAGGIYINETLQFLSLINDDDFSNIVQKAIDIFYENLAYENKCDKFNELDCEFCEIHIDKYHTLYEKCIKYLKNNLEM